jgi:hypothetical protein
VDAASRTRADALSPDTGPPGGGGAAGAHDVAEWRALVRERDRLHDEVEALRALAGRLAGEVTRAHETSDATESARRPWQLSGRLVRRLAQRWWGRRER